MERHLPTPGNFLTEAIDEVKSLESQRRTNKTTLLIIDDSYHKGDLQKRVLGETWDPNQKELPISVHRAYTAGKGLAFLKMYYAHHDLLQEEAGKRNEEYVTPPLIVAMDGSLPFQRGERPRREMGINTTKAILQYCETEELPTPYFVGYSSDYDQGQAIEALLKSRGEEEKYLGSYFHSREEQIIESLQALSNQ